VERPLLGVDGLGNAAQKHHRSGDDLACPSKLWGIIPLVHDVALDLTGAPLGAARQVMRTWCNVLRRAHRHRWRLVLLPLS
jgi:hypothetical protein